MGAQDLEARLEVSGNEAIRGHAVPYRIINTGTARIICGVGYTLEREAGSEWVEMNPGMAFAAVGLIIEPGEDRELWARMPMDAPSGQYRIQRATAEATAFSEPLRALPSPLTRCRISINWEATS